MENIERKEDESVNFAEHLDLESSKKAIDKMEEYDQLERLKRRVKKYGWPEYERLYKETKSIQEALNKLNDYFEKRIDEDRQISEKALNNDEYSLDIAERVITDVIVMLEGGLNELKTFIDVKKAKDIYTKYSVYNRNEYTTSVLSSLLELAKNYLTQTALHRKSFLKRTALDDMV